MDTTTYQSKCAQLANTPVELVSFCRPARHAQLPNLEPCLILLVFVYVSTVTMITVLHNFALHVMLPAKRV